MLLVLTNLNSEHLGAVGLCVKTMEPIKPAAPAVASPLPRKEEEEEESMPVQTGFNFETGSVSIPTTYPSHCHELFLGAL